MKKITLSFLILLLFLTACVPKTPTMPAIPPTEKAPAAPTPPPTNAPAPAANTPSPPPVPAPPLGNTPLVISEVMAGDLDFVELFNASLDAINLKGYRLVYRLGTTEKDLPLYTFERNLTLPPYGHALLALKDNDPGMAVDGVFSQQLNIKTGGIGLYTPNGQLADAAAWGKAPPLFTEGDPAPELPKNASLQRLPGGSEGNFRDTNNNANDFTIAAPNPLNSLASPTPLLDNRLDLRLLTDDSAEPGKIFAYQLELENLSERDLRNLTVTLPLTGSLTVIDIEAGGAQDDDGRVVWKLDTLPAGEETALGLTAQAPWTYARIHVSGYSAVSPDLPRPAYGPAAITNVQGGVIPIRVARSLPRGTRVTIEGVATMYTGGYYAGGGNTKFYAQDDSGGIQVQVFGESGPLPEVSLGDRARISGYIEHYRDSIEIIPEILPADVEILGAETPPAPKTMSAAEAIANPQNAGEYIAVTGLATRIEEATYSYEIDIMDAAGDTIFLYVDKETRLTADELNEGALYTVAGILEYYQGKWQLKPRIPADFQRVYPAALRLELSAPNVAAPGDPITYTLTAYNHTAEALTQLAISSATPAALAQIFDGGAQEDNTVFWEIPSLPPNDNASVRFSVIAPQQGVVTNDAYGAVALEWPTPVTGPAFRTFIGNTVPIWAIQGDGYKSPYVNSYLQTEGVVTAIFDPDDIPGFFLQEKETDDDPATSAGLFARAENAQVSVGDWLRVGGVVKEKSGQTELLLDELEILPKPSSPFQPVVLHPPADEMDAARYYEALEGMLVHADGVAVSPISKYGETALLRPERNLQRVMKGDPLGRLIILDDNSWTARYDDAAALPFSITTGDAVQDITGPLAYTYGQYKVEPIAPPFITPGDFERHPSLPEVGADGFSLATCNAENFFDNKDPNPASPPRPNAKEYRHKAAKIANSIAAMGYPTLIAFEEVENVDVLEKVAKQPALEGYPYQAVLVEGRDSRGIDVGYLLRSDRAEVLSYTLRLDDEGLFTRGPLLLKSLIHTADGEVTLYTLANHFVSMGAGFEATEPRRVQQAQWNLDIVREIQAREPDAHIAILGDLNTFLDAPAMNVLYKGGLRHVFEQLPPEERYTYIFQGESETLDHILVTPGLAKLINAVHVLHINADFPPPAPDDESPQRASDHDPVVVWFGENKK